MSSEKFGFWQCRIVGEAQNFSRVGSEVFGNASLRQFSFQVRRQEQSELCVERDESAIKGCIVKS